MTWKNGRQLAALQQGNSAISYPYGEDGLRSKKVVNGYTSTYLRDDSGRLISYTANAATGSHGMWFYYNPGSTTPDSIVYDGNRYIYFKNVQGDILGIVDANGNLAAAYDYDSWGKCAYVYDGNLKVNADPNFIGNINPLRYRGYEYDTETGLFYVASRYYDPTTGRYINADGYVQTGQGLNSTNMFAYCLNNPINMVDYGGCDPTPIWATNIINGTASDADYAKALSVDPNAWAGFARNTVDRAIAIAQEYSYNNYIEGYSEHQKKGTTNPANRNDHENAEARRKRDKGGEKGDARRKPNPNKRQQPNTPKNGVGEKIIIGAVTLGEVAVLVYVVANDATGIGAADDAAVAPLLKIIWDTGSKVFA